MKTGRTRSAADFSLPTLLNAGSWYRAVDDLRSDASRAIDLAWKRYHNGIGRFILSVKLRRAQQIQTETLSLQQGLVER